MQTGHLPKVDSMKEVLRHVRLARVKTSTQCRQSKVGGKDSVVKMMATNVISFIAEGMQSNEAHNEVQNTHVQFRSSPPAVAAAMGNQHIRAQVSY